MSTVGIAESREHESLVLNTVTLNQLHKLWHGLAGQSRARRDGHLRSQSIGSCQSLHITSHRSDVARRFERMCQENI
jgi:hypothetical protein